ncbi:MAG: hypothetical protein IAE87_19980, partial [Rhodobacteraceae bacterium]|nr:hypothetical protein [Paracoccaceae bacterium]
VPCAASVPPEELPARTEDSAPETGDEPPAARPAAPRWLVRPVGLVLGIGLLALALPYGATRAGIAHLMGEDLRRMT